jgi:hypothetical protein
LEISIKI